MNVPEIELEAVVTKVRTGAKAGAATELDSSRIFHLIAGYGYISYKIFTKYLKIPSFGGINAKMLCTPGRKMDLKGGGGGELSICTIYTPVYL